MKMTGAQIVVETLIEQGCDTIFGYPGGTITHIYDELYKNSHRINHILTAHEQGAAHAADGYARVSGKPGVVLATSGPGVTNTVTGIANAYLDSTPMVAITGNVLLNQIGRDSFQEVDTTGITMPITKHNYIVKDISELADTIREAFSIAISGRPGPVLVDIPKNIQMESYDYSPENRMEKTPYLEPEEADLRIAAQILNKAERPFILCGGGTVLSGAGDEVMRLSEMLDAPVGFSMMGLSAVPGAFKNAVGMTGMHGKYTSTAANAEADLIIAIGARFSERVTGNVPKYTKNAKIIHIDIDPAEIDKNISAYVGLVGDVKEILNRLLDMLKTQKRPDWQERINELRKEEASYSPDESGMHPKAIIDRVSRLASKDTIIATDVGQHQMWTAQYFEFKKPRTFITSGGLGTMGFGMGGAIGSCIASGRQKTVLFTGDGSFGMNLNELATAVTNELPLVIILLNNGSLGMVRQWQTLFFDERYSSTTLCRKTDFVKLAEAFGAIGFRAANISEFDEALKKAFEINTPVLIDCTIDINDVVLPMVPPGGSIENIILK